MDLEKLFARKRELVAAMNAIVAKPEVTAEDDAKFGELDAEITKIDRDIDIVQRAQALQVSITAGHDVQAGRTGQSLDQVADTSRQYNQAFFTYLAHGHGRLSDSQRELMAGNLREIQGAQSVGTDSAGGYTVPEEFFATLTEAMKAYGGVRALATVMTTSTGADLPMPTSNDTANKAVLLDENTAMTEQDVVFGSVTLNAHMYTSKLIRVSIQLLQDSAFNLEEFLRKIMAERFGRGLNDHFTTGTGTNQPRGVITASAVGVTAASATAITLDDLINLEHSVDPAYRTMPSAAWMWHDTTLRNLKKLKDADGRPLWQPSLEGGQQNQFMGYRYSINQSMAVGAVNAKTVAFGDFGQYYIRDVQAMVIQRLVERYAEFLQRGFLGFSRHDGDLLDAGTNPVKVLQQAAA